MAVTFLSWLSGPAESARRRCNRRYIMGTGKHINWGRREEARGHVLPCEARESKAFASVWLLGAGQREASEVLTGYSPPGNLS